MKQIEEKPVTENINNEENTAEKPPEKRLKILGVEFVYIYLFGIAVAFFGWMLENSFKFAVSGKFDSRFHILPFISPYALVPFGLHLALGNADDLTFFGKRLFKERSRKNVIISNVVTYFIICCCIFLGELAVGNAWDIFFGVELWNYTKHPLHVTQYTSPISTFGFGTVAYLIFKFVYAPALNFLRKHVKYKTAKWICLTLGVLIVLDTVRMMLCIVFLGEAPNLWGFYDGKFVWMP